MKNKKPISIILSSLLLVTSLYSEEKKQEKVKEENTWKKYVDKNIDKIDKLDKEFDTPINVKKDSKVAEGEGSWSLVNSNCEPELNIDGAFDEMTDMYMKAFEKALNIDTFKPYLMNKSLEGMINYVAMSNCMTQLDTSLANPVNKADMSSKMTECVNKNTKGTITSETGTTVGTEFSQNTKQTIDYASLGATSTCVGTVYGKKQSEVFNQCMDKEKKNLLEIFNGKLKLGIDQANIDFSQQQQKCILDSQNYENSVQGIIGDGWKTLSNGDKVTLIHTNAVDENIEDTKINRSKALTLSSSISKSMVKSSTFSKSSNTDVLGYSIILNNWSNRVFENNCETVKVETDSVNASVLNCRWDDKTTANLTTNQIDELSDSAKSKVTVMEECKEMTKLNPLFINEPEIVMLENGKNPITDLNVVGAKNRFDYFLKVDKKWNSKNLILSDGTKFNTLASNINKNIKLTKTNEYAMRTVCRNWAIDYKDSINSQILNMSTITASNQASGGEEGQGISEKTDKLRHIMETKQENKIQAKLKMIDDLIRELELRLSQTQQNEDVNNFGINIK